MSSGQGWAWPVWLGSPLPLGLCCCCWAGVALVHGLVPGLPPVAVLGSRGEKEKQFPDVGGRGRAMPLWHVLEAKQVTRPGQIQGAVGAGGGGGHTSMEGNAQSPGRGPACRLRALRITADNFANDLARSHHDFESLKPPCEGGISHPVFQVRKQTKRIIPSSFLSTGPPSVRGMDWPWEAAETGTGQPSTGEAQGRRQTWKQTQGSDPSCREHLWGQKRPLGS